jgi:apolipoprotein N-acyltransferase
VTPLAGFLLSALFGILSFPPLGVWPLSYVALVPFLAAATSAKPRAALAWGYLSGFLFFGGLLYWIGFNCGAPPALAWASTAAVVAILATIWALTAWAVSHAARRLSPALTSLLFVTLYLFLEVFWGTGEMGFPWAVWALTQVGFLPAAQMAELGDVWLLSLWVLAINALVFLVWKWPVRRRVCALSLALVLILPPLLGFARMKTFRLGVPLPVAAVQGNTPMEEKWQQSAEEILQNYLDLSRSLANTDTRLIVWPETAVPMPVRFRPWARQKLQSFVDSTGIALLSGATDYREGGRAQMLPYNSAFLFLPGAREPQSYAKMHLVPFGERIPGQKLLPTLGKIRLGQAEFEPGEEAVVFRPGGLLPPFSCMICFEVLFPDVAARMLKGGATLLVNITEDGWYSNTSGPYQHLALTKLRAIATRRSIVRAANTGISALILPTGAATAELGYGRSGVIRGVLPVQHEITLATRLAGFWLPFYTAVLLVVLTVLCLMRRRAAHSPS